MLIVVTCVVFVHVSVYVSGCEAGYRKPDSFPLTFLPLFISRRSLGNMHISFNFSTLFSVSVF